MLFILHTWKLLVFDATVYLLFINHL